MEPTDLGHRLTSIQTQWTLLFQAHQGQGDAATAAQQQLLLRYYGAVYRYLLGTLHDPAAAEELTQEFAVRFLRGDFKRADPQQGRFRDFLKTALRHLAMDHWRKQEKRPAPLPSVSSEQLISSPPQLDELDQPFLDKWREELLARTWEALAQVEAEAGQPYHTVLRWKTEHPELRAAELAEQLGTHSGKVFTIDGVRQLLHRARKRFAELLVDEVARSLETSEVELIAQELIDLDLLCYCQSVLQRREQASER
jgi:RNA polymerase sigma-70 factor (ECF subfamily)